MTVVYQHELPNVPGKSIKGVLVEYGPGGYSPGHTHPKSAFIYATVLEGEILSQVNDGPVTTYKAAGFRAGKRNRTARQYFPFPLGEVRRVCHANNCDRTFGLEYLDPADDPRKQGPQ